MNFAVIKGASYGLIQACNMVVHQGTTQTSEKRKNPDSEYLKKLPEQLRSFEETVQYPPNQAYIGNITPHELADIPRPWYENPLEDANRVGKYGEIMPEDEFIGLIKVVDVFDLVFLEKNFQESAKEKIIIHPVLKDLKGVTKLEKDGMDIEEIEKIVQREYAAEPIYYEHRLVGYVKKAHDYDQALSAHVMFENLVSKASAVYALALLFQKTDLKAQEVDYIIEASEEACGDMNQRGGGNFAKAIGEVCGCVNATGSDTRGFCAAPVHALIEAASLVQAGVYKNVVVLAGGATAKLGMNGKEHVAKKLPVLEDLLGAFAVHVSENDGINPVIRTDVIGKHKIGSGGSPQAVTQALVTEPLEKKGIKFSEIDMFAVEMQNPEITEPAGAGDVPKANYKMIAALGVKQGEFDRADIDNQVARFGMPGFAPTQGHIPSGVPVIGYARDMIMQGKINKAMIIGKGSLFLGRLTHLFDGVSFVMENNTGKVDVGTGVNKEEVRKIIAEAIRNLAGSLKT
ncbi:MAG: glycine reductase [Clostridia bacterium]|nr:glycine reductase [Clostridia bacterium]